MPAIATHYLFGKEVYKNLITKNRRDIISIIRKHKKDFDLGLQGPDPLFYYRPTKKNAVAEYAGEIHNQSGSVFIERAVEQIRQTHDMRMFAYTMGFVCHFALDSELHPTVIRLGGDDIGHIRIETELDREILLREILAKDAKKREEKYLKGYKSRFRIPNPFAKKNELVLYEPKFYHPKPSIKPEKIHRDRLIRYEEGLADVIAPLYPKLEKEQVQECLDSFIKYNRLIYSPMGGNISVLKKLESIVRRKGIFSSLALTNRRFQDQVDHARSLVPMVDQSVEPATRLLINFYDAVRHHIKLSDRFDRTFG